MIISYSKNFVYIHLEKTGGTSVEFALDPILTEKDIIIGSTPRGELSENKYSYLWKHSSAQDVKKYLENKYDSMYKFATVRDPSEILISLYYYCETIISKFINISDSSLTKFFNDPNSSANIFWKKDMPYMFYYYESYINKTGVDGFIKLVLSNESKFKLLPQVDRLDDSIELFDISTINDHWDYILNKINVNGVKIKTLNKSNRPDNVDISDESVALILENFKKDYETILEKTGANWKYYDKI